MAGSFSFSGDQSLQIHEGSIIWNDAQDPSMLDYSDATNNTLTDSINDAYVTAVEDNETQYLSILETSNDITLDDLHNLTINSKIQQENMVYTEEVAENTNTVDSSEQVVVFTVDGSDDLFGIQFAQDEEGKLQKYQFKFRSTENGQLEAIPDSIQLLPNDEDIHSDSTQETLQIQSEQTKTLHILPDNTVEERNEVLQGELPNDQCLEVAETRGNHQIFVKGENLSPFHTANESNVKQEIYEEQESYLEVSQDEFTICEGDTNYDIESVDSKKGILEGKKQSQAIASSLGNVKQELFQEEVHVQQDEEPHETGERFETPSTIESRNLYQIEESTDQIHNEDDGEGVQNSKMVTYDYFHNHPDEVSPPEIEQHYEEIYVQEDHIGGSHNIYQDVDNPTSTASVIENDSDNEDYQIVDGMHVTGDLESNINEPETILRELLEKPSDTNILKHSFINNTNDVQIVQNKKDNNVLYYVIQHPEKENVETFSGTVKNGETVIQKPATKNPRSILKSSFSFPKESTLNMSDERLNKRFARSKEAVQAKLFHNFISRTTIPQAPVRQKRLPRKQEIKPVDERRNEEIIVQEVMVSSNGFVENVVERLKYKDKLEVTAVVELSDSDEDYDPKKSHRKKKKQRKHKKSSGNETDSDVSVIEILQSDEEEIVKDSQDFDNPRDSPRRGRGRPKKSQKLGREKNNFSNVLKRGRGRPGKSSHIDLNSEESPSKRSRTESDDTETEKKDSSNETEQEPSGTSLDKKEICCPHCSKSFASQNSLNTHIQHHNLENCLKNTKNRISKSGISVRPSLLPIMEYKHKCKECEQTFKNTILLQRHVCSKKPTLNCSICLKSFKDVTMLNIHKKSHAKQNLIKNTSLVKVSPRKSIMRPSPKKFQPRKSIRPASKTFVCQDCSKVCSSEDSLITHSKVHKKFTCVTCSANFTSRLLLDTHVRTNCVKSKSPLNKRLSFKIRRSFVHTPPRVSSKIPSRKSSINPSNISLNQSVSMFKLECEICKMKFTTHRNLFTHKVQKHGLDTPDKSVLTKQKKTSYKQTGAHSGIPANDRMKKAYAALRKKLELEEKKTEKKES